MKTLIKFHRKYFTVYIDGFCFFDWLLFRLGCDPSIIKKVDAFTVELSLPVFDYIPAKPLKPKSSRKPKPPPDSGLTGITPAA